MNRVCKNFNRIAFVCAGFSLFLFTACNQEENGASGVAGGKKPVTATVLSIPTKDSATGSTLDALSLKYAGTWTTGNCHWFLNDATGNWLGACDFSLTKSLLSTGKLSTGENWKVVSIGDNDWDSWDLWISTSERDLYKNKLIILDSTGEIVWSGPIESATDSIWGIDEAAKKVYVWKKK
jgi:hypothetical protein